MGSWKQALMARGVDCSWIQLVSHALSLSFKRKNIQRATERERESVCGEKHIALQELQSLCAHRKKGKRSSPFSIKNGFLILPFSCASPLKPPIRTCRCYLQRGRCRAPSLSPFLLQITTHAMWRPRRKTQLPRQRISHLWSWCQGGGKLRAKIQINKTLSTCSFNIYIPLNTSVCAVYSGTCLSLGVIKSQASKMQRYDL